MSEEMFERLDPKYKVSRRLRQGMKTEAARIYDENLEDADEILSWLREDQKDDLLEGIRGYRRRHADSEGEFWSLSDKQRATVRRFQNLALLKENLASGPSISEASSWAKEALRGLSESEREELRPALPPHAKDLYEQEMSAIEKAESDLFEDEGPSEEEDLSEGQDLSEGEGQSSKGEDSKSEGHSKDKGWGYSDEGRGHVR